ncbi:MAG TPA: hypothetical protein VLA56_09905 [Pseudomonadales bacterium]|nr:hypothetical protein [Pseudomonadales bacterium]
MSYARAQPSVQEVAAVVGRAQVLDARLATPVAQAPPRITLSLRRLLLLYLIVPACLAVVAVDAFLLGGALRPHLPRKPETYLLYELFLGWPHIVASTIILTTNREYVSAYRHRLIVASAVVIAFFGIGEFTLPRNVLFFVAATATIVHVLKQQVGIGRGALRPDGATARHYTTWGWTAIVAGVVLYNGLYLDDFDPYKGWLVAASGALALATVVQAWRIQQRTDARLGHAFLWSNTSMVVVGVLFYASGYGMFAIVVPRVVHDITAFAFYVAHDVNKHGARPANRLYRFARRIPAGIYWVTPVLAIVTAYLLAEHGNAAFHWATGGILRETVPKAVSLGVLGYLGMMHYYYESFTWKSGSPYRAHISMRA